MIPHSALSRHFLARFVTILKRFPLLDTCCYLTVVGLHAGGYFHVQHLTWRTFRTRWIVNLQILLILLVAINANQWFLWFRRFRSHVKTNGYDFQ